MDEGSSQGIRYHSRNYHSIQPRPEWGRRTGKQNNHGESQGWQWGGKARQKAMDGSCRYNRVSQESQSNKCSRNYTLRSMVRKETGPISSPNPWKYGIRPRSKGKAYEARYTFAQGNSGRLWRHEPIQGMGSDKERRCGFKGRGIHRREASQPNASSLRGRTENRSRVDHGPARTTRRAATDAASDRERGFRIGRTRAGHGRPSESIAGIYGERTSRVSRWVSNRWTNRRVNKDVGKVEQGHPYLYEVPRRNLQSGTSSYGKDSEEHQ